MTFDIASPPRPPCTYRTHAERAVFSGTLVGPEIAEQPLVRPEGTTLPGRECYSRSVARLFNVPSAQTATTTTLKAGQIAVSRLASAERGTGLSLPIPPERAYMITLQLRDSPASELWKAGQRLAAGPFVAGSIVIAHLEDEPSFNLHDSFDMLLVHVPQIVFDELADDHGAPRIGQFIDQAGAMDAVVHDLGRALLPSIGASIRESQLFDHITIAIYARLATRFGLLQPPQPSSGRRLTARQERVAKEALVADLTRQPVMEKVALACGLPVSRLIRAFRNTTGVPPHSWLRSFRVERAKDLLLNSSLSLGQIAYECGFADQSHLTRTFSAAVGTTPGAWRRARRA